MFHTLLSHVYQIKCELVIGFIVSKQNYQTFREILRL